MPPLRRAQIAPVLLLLSASAGIAAAFVPWLQVDVYVITGADGVLHWQSSTPISPLPDLFQRHNIPLVWGNPPGSFVVALLLFGPPAIAILLALAALLTARFRTRGDSRWLERACLITGLLDLAAVAYVMAVFTDPFHFHEIGVLTVFPTIAQPGLALALVAGIGTIAAGIVLLLSRRARRAPTVTASTP